MTRKTTKEIAQRIDPTYFCRPHPLRRARALLSLVFCGAALLWVAAAFAMGDQTLFSNGSLAGSHLPVQRDCGQCHAVRFDRVYDSSCLQCHHVGPHVPPKKGRDPACATCHAEHRGRHRLTAVGDSHCNECHEDHDRITDFETHSAFAPPKHEQHLHFSHRRHLAPDLAEGPLDCVDCHIPAGIGGHFRPIAFDEHCARCHTDRLDGDVDVAVPHGVQPGRLREWVAGAFVRRMTAEGEIVARTGQPSAVPGRGTSERPDWATALERRTEGALRSLFTPGRARGCLLCHVARDGEIVPPAVPANWLPRARFDHKTHRFRDCAFCHDMSDNQHAEQLELPPISVCRSCHQEGGAVATCATCHPYHPLDQTDAWR